MSESGGGDSSIPSTMTTSPVNKGALGGGGTAAAAAAPSNNLAALSPTPAPRTSTPCRETGAGGGGDAGKEEAEKRQREWMEIFLSSAAKLTIADYMNMFMHIRMRQEHMRGDESYCATVAVHPNHYIRNRYRDILPYDKNRVLIGSDALENVEGYVNASHVSLPNGLTTFIAAQAPLPQTLDDFWQMVDEQGIQLVVMLCKLVEMSKVKCERYWPERVGAPEVYGMYEITLEKEERFEDDEYLLRTLRMRQMREGGVTRTVHQLHYKEWPDHGCPTGSSQLLNMVDRMAELAGSTTVPKTGTAATTTAAAATDNASPQPEAPSNGNASPIATKERPPVLVHCSAGVGRTGTIILINHIRELIMQNLFIDVNLLLMVVALREQRSSMVQTQDQFQFVYRCVVTYCRRALGLPDVEEGAGGGGGGGELPAPPPYVTSMAGGSSSGHPKLPTGLITDSAHHSTANHCVARKDTVDESDEDEDTDFEDATGVPDYPDEPTRTPRGPEDMNSSSC
uniref:Tyrosine phosphatase n=1 Tax=Pristionchus pacificus TaxID=54126 RepID=A0A8R1Y4B6_PRIPA